jgi:ATP-dependent DNA helicase RecG
VAIYENRIEIFSPGSFPAALNIKNLKQGISYIRNIAICKVFREAGYIEKLGSGLPVIFQSYRDRNLKEPSIIEGENFIKCILPREQMEKVEEKENPILCLFDTSAKIVISDVVRTLKISRTSAGRMLDRLIHEGRIEKIGKGRGSCYVKC